MLILPPSMMVTFPFMYAPALLDNWRTSPPISVEFPIRLKGILSGGRTVSSASGKILAVISLTFGEKVKSYLPAILPE